MNAEAIVAISAAVVACTQLVKWAGLRDHWGPIVVIGFSGLGVVIWLTSQEAFPPARTDTWNIFAGWVAVTLSAAGVFGFTRAGAEAVTRATAPPSDGAGSSATTPGPQSSAPTLAEITDELERRLRETPAVQDALLSRPPTWLPDAPTAPSAAPRIRSSGRVPSRPLQEQP